MDALIRHSVSVHPSRTKEWRWSHSEAVRRIVYADVEQGVLERNLSFFPFFLSFSCVRRDGGG